MPTRPTPTHPRSGNAPRPVFLHLRRIGLMLFTALVAGLPEGAGTLAAPALARAGARTPINPELLERTWDASWIVAEGTAPHDYGVYHFRKAFELEAAPESFIVHVTADNRYQLFVNGNRVADGPARGSLKYWKFESVDLAPYLKPGRNVLAAVVWNAGPDGPLAQISWKTGFILQGDGPLEARVNTDPSWKAMENPAYQPLHFTHGEMRGFFVVGPAEEVDGARYPWGWERPDFDDTGWSQARLLRENGRSNGTPRLVRDPFSEWMLIPRPIPFMETSPERLQRVRQAEGARPPADFLREPVRFTIPPNTRARLLLDNGTLTTAYPELTVSGGAGARIQLGYAEALFEPGGRRGMKGDRDVVAGKEFIGFHDRFMPDGGDHRNFRPLWWRTYRYMELVVETAGTPLVIEDLKATFTAYPFERRARFEADDPVLQRMLDVGWRTARLCAHETYVDCPYYEQLQYAGDTRVQALISYYNSGDPRLARDSILLLDQSRTPEGLTMSRAPSRQHQYIPGYSLWWIGMVHDYWYYTDDPDLVKSVLPGIRAVLTFFENYQREDGSLRELPWWTYVDWTDWQRGEPPRGTAGHAAPHDLQLLLAYQWAAEIEAAFGLPWQAARYRRAAELLRGTIFQLYWCEDRQLLADTTDKQAFSQHSNILAVLGGVIAGPAARAIMEQVISDPTLTPASFYFRNYLNQALNRAGLGDRYLRLLGPWEEMLELNLTTWAERPARSMTPPRSDCHAWSASPNIELFGTVLGIAPAAPGFREVRIAPHLGELNAASGEIPHPAGTLAVNLRRVDGDALAVEIVLPAGVSGTFVHQGHTRDLRPGRNAFSVDKDRDALR